MSEGTLTIEEVEDTLGGILGLEKPYPGIFHMLHAVIDLKCERNDLRDQLAREKTMREVAEAFHNVAVAERDALRARMPLVEEGRNPWGPTDW